MLLRRCTPAVTRGYAAPQYDFLELRQPGQRSRPKPATVAARALISKARRRRPALRCGDSTSRAENAARRNAPPDLLFTNTIAMIFFCLRQ